MFLVQLGGLEPPTSCSTDRRSNQLSYNCIAIAPKKIGARFGRKLGATTGFCKAGTMRSRWPIPAQKGPDLTARAFSLSRIKNQAAGL